MSRERCRVCGGWHEPGVHERGNPFRIESSEPIGYVAWPKRSGASVGGRFRLDETDRVPPSVALPEPPPPESEPRRRWGRRVALVLLFAAIAGGAVGTILDDRFGSPAGWWRAAFGASESESPAPDVTADFAAPDREVSPTMTDPPPPAGTGRLETAPAEDAARPEAPPGSAAEAPANITIEVFGQPADSGSGDR